MRRHFLPLGLLLTCVVLLPACNSDGHFTLGGYTSAPNHRCDIKTVYVPICKNRTFRRGLEFEVAKALIREIQTKTPYRVVSSPSKADSELQCTIVNVTKRLINQNQVGEVRDVETLFSVEVVWLDLRPGHEGERLSGSGAGQIANQKPRDRNWPLPEMDGKRREPRPILLTPTTNYIPELGQSNASAEQTLANRLAVQIVSMMEEWR